MIWEIARFGGTCEGCGSPFPEGTTYRSALLETPEGLRRTDRCAACWERDPPATVCSWQGRIPETPDRPPTVTTEGIRACFEGLASREDEESRRLRYLLALTLIRRKVFRLDRVDRSDGAEHLLLREWNGGEPFPVEAPSLTETELDGVRDRLAEILGIRPSEGKETAGPTAGAETGS